MTAEVVDGATAVALLAMVLLLLSAVLSLAED